MKYFKYKEEDYCIHYKYLTYEEANNYYTSYDVEESDGDFEQDLCKVMNPASNLYIHHTEYMVKQKFGIPQYANMYCVVTLDKVVRVNNENQYTCIAQSFSRRSVKDPHVKAIARKTAVARLLKNNKFESEFKHLIFEVTK